jgi:WD40 repeat protein
VSLIDAETLKERSRFRAVPNAPVAGMAYVPGGRSLVVGGDDGFLAIFDPARGRLVTRLQGNRGGPLLTPAFSADGRLMATAAAGDAVLLWTLRSGRPVGRPRRYSPSLGAWGVSLSPDGRTLAVAAVGVGIEIVDVASLRRRAILPGTETVRSLARFTPDGRFLVAGSYKGWARLWSTDTWRPATRKLAGHTGEVTWESVSPDGRMLATGSTDGTTRLFDLATHRPVGAPLPGPPNRQIDRVERRAARARLRPRLLARVSAGRLATSPSTSRSVAIRRGNARDCGTEATARLSQVPGRGVRGRRLVRR